MTKIAFIIYLYCLNEMSVHDPYIRGLSKPLMFDSSLPE